MCPAFLLGEVDKSLGRSRNRSGALMRFGGLSLKMLTEPHTLHAFLLGDWFALGGSDTASFLGTYLDSHLSTH